MSPPAVFIQNLPSKRNVWVFSHTERCDFTSDSCEMDCYPGIANDQVFKGQHCDRH